MRNIKLTIAYDGTDFFGWQRQGSLRTVQGVIEKALEQIHNAHIVLYGSGRTDKGVHALAQAANFYTSIENIAAKKFVPALNGFLPQDIRITDAVEVNEKFHARFDAVMRLYRYHIICTPCMMPHEARYAMHLKRRPNLQTLNNYARLLYGEADCSLFASPRDLCFSRGSGSKYRFIKSAYFFYDGAKLIFEISANAFFWKMVRSIVGTLLYYEERNTPVLSFKKILIEGDHNKAGTVVCAKGLFLWNIDY